MTKAVDAIYEDGVFKPEEPVGLEEKTKVRLAIQEKTPTSSVVADDDPTGWKTADQLIGRFKGGPQGEHIGRDHDKHLYK